MTTPTSALVPNESFVREAIGQANLNALRMALYQLTGDPRLGEMRVSRSSVRRGAMFVTGLKKADEEVVISLAFDYLSRQVPLTSTTPNSDVVDLLQKFTGEPVTGAEARYANEELSALPRSVKWSSSPSTGLLSTYHVTIIGAGISGLAVAIKLKELGIPFEIVERQSDIGRTWHLNDYPDARVDISHYLYQYKFDTGFRWSSDFPRQTEIKRYLRYIATKYSLLDHIVLNTEVTAADWDGEYQRWVVTKTGIDGSSVRSQSRFVVSASGLFSTPSLPDIPGIKTYEGAIFHTTGWDHDFEVARKRVAVIGTGSSGTQIMPGLAKKASALAVFQRTPNWLSPISGYDRSVSPEQQWLFETLPLYRNWYGLSAFLSESQVQALQTYDPAWQKNNQGVSELNEHFRSFLESYIHKKLAGRSDLIRKCLPTYPPLARRLVVDNGWYDALMRDNVELVDTPIRAFVPKGIVTQDGAERAFDLVVLGSGFKTSQYLFPAKYSGRNGVTPDKLWSSDGARAYLGLTLPNFPNFFMLYGPNGQPRAGGFHGWAEQWGRYVARLIVNTIERGAKSFEVSQDAYENYNAALDARMDNLIWGKDGAGSYYQNEFGRCGIKMPWTAVEYFDMLSADDTNHYILK